MVRLETKLRWAPSGHLIYRDFETKGGRTRSRDSGVFSIKSEGKKVEMRVMELSRNGDGVQSRVVLCLGYLDSASKEELKLSLYEVAMQYCRERGEDMRERGEIDVFKFKGQINGRSY